MNEALEIAQKIVAAAGDADQTTIDTALRIATALFDHKRFVQYSESTSSSTVLQQSAPALG